MIELDKEDQWLLASYKWHIQKTTPAYAFRQFTDDGKLVREYLHRRVIGAKADELVDHVNGEGLDCRKSNLRICTHAENMRNRKVSKSNKLGIKGVWYERGRFRSEVKADGKKYRLGSFRTAEEAAEAYRVASERLHGDFARTA